MSMTTTIPETATGELALEITRVFNAPRDLVFKAWTDTEHMARWAGPEGYSATVVELDGRPGGAYLERDLLIGKALCVYWPHSWNRVPGTPIPFPLFPNVEDMRIVR